MPTTSPRRVSRSTLSTTVPHEPRDLQRDVGGRSGLGLVRRAQLLAADHRRDQSVLVDVGDVPGADPLPVAQHRDPVADREDLVETVGDVDDTEPGCADALQGGEQGRHLLARQRRGRLVDHEHPRRLPVPQRPGDRHAGPLGRAELGHRSSYVEVVAQGLHPSLDVPALRVPADPPAPRRHELATEHEVLDGAEGLDETEVLMHEPEARVARVRGRGQIDVVAREPDLHAGVGWW